MLELAEATFFVLVLGLPTRRQLQLLEGSLQEAVFLLFGRASQ